MVVNVVFVCRKEYWAVFLHISRFITSLSYITLFVYIYISSLNLCILFKRKPHICLWFLSIFGNSNKLIEIILKEMGKHHKTAHYKIKESFHFWFQFCVCFLSDFTRYCWIFGHVYCLFKSLSKLTFPLFFSLSILVW